MFATGSANPNERAQLLLAKVAPVLMRLPEEIAVVGHTDSAPYAGNGKTNWELSTERANATRRLLTDAGLADTRVSRVTGLADRDPLLPADPLAAANRRIAIIVLRGTAKPAGPAAAPPIPAVRAGSHRTARLAGCAVIGRTLGGAIHREACRAARGIATSRNAWSATCAIVRHISAPRAARAVVHVAVRRAIRTGLHPAIHRAASPVIRGNVRTDLRIDAGCGARPFVRPAIRRAIRAAGRPAAGSVIRPVVRPVIRAVIRPTSPRRPRRRRPDRATHADDRRPGLPDALRVRQLPGLGRQHRAAGRGPAVRAVDHRRRRDRQLRHGQQHARREAHARRLRQDHQGRDLQEGRLRRSAEPAVLPDAAGQHQGQHGAGGRTSRSRKKARRSRNTRRSSPTITPPGSSAITCAWWG